MPISPQKYLYFDSNADDASELHASGLTLRLEFRRPIYYAKGSDPDRRMLAFAWTSRAATWRTCLVGDDIADVADIAYDIAKITELSFRFDFNGHELEVCPRLDTGPKRVVETYHNLVQAEYDAYWTPERRAEQAAKEAAATAAVDAHFAGFDLVTPGLGGLEALLDWFLVLETLAAGLSMEQREHAREVCASKFGVTAGMNCVPDDPTLTRKEVAQWRARQTREFMLYWLLGQCVEMTVRGGCPHQMTPVFAATIRAMPREPDVDTRV